MASDNFTKATVSRENKKRLTALKRRLTMLAQGVAVSEDETIGWLLDQPEAQRVLRDGK